MLEVVLTDSTQTVLLQTPSTEVLALREIATELLLTPASEQVVLAVQSIEILEVARQGLPGPAGNTGPMGLPGDATLQALAGQALGGHRVVVLAVGGSLLYADCTQPSHFGRIAGVTLGAAALGGNVICIKSGLLTEPSWAWQSNQPLYLGQSGALTQSPPLTGFQQIVGVALNPTTVYIHLREPIFIL